MRKMEYFPSQGPAGAREESFAGCTLVVAAVGAGNVGQLAADLLVSTLTLPRCGALEDPNVLPCVGNAPYTHVPGVALSLELYGEPNKGLIVLQQRAPAVTGTQRIFARNLAEWVKNCAFKEVVILVGLSAQWRTAQRVGYGLQLCYLASAAGSDEGTHPRCVELELAQLQDVEFTPEARKEAHLPPWPTFEALRDLGVDVVTLVAFCSEGDNIPDSAAVAQLAAHYLNIGERGALPWQMPPSWGHLYGPPPEVGLF